MNAALIGIGGWGAELLGALRDLDARGELALRAVSDVDPGQNKAVIDELAGAGTAFYRDYREMLRVERALDVVAIATPLHLHRPMATDAMEAGCHVFLEKPPAVTIQDLDAIIRTAEQSGRHCAVDFLNSSGPAFLELRRQIAAGVLGDVRTITGIGLWERLDSYYSRTNWAGRLVVNGNYVLDGTVNNPLSHLLNNMILLGQAAPNGCEVSRVTAELYHAHDIDGEDTSCIRVEMSGGMELYFYATLCNDGQETPMISVEGAKGTAYWDYTHKMTITSGGTKVIREPSQNDADHRQLLANMFRNLIGVVTGSEKSLFCSARDTRGFLLASNGAFESSRGTRAIPSHFITRTPRGDSAATLVHGIRDLIHEAAARRSLFSEMGVAWASPGRETDMRGYRRFDMKF